MTAVEPSPEPTTPMTGARWAVRLGALLVAGLLAVTAFSLWDRLRLRELESFAPMTGVGDAAFVQLPSASEMGPKPVLATFEGQPLYAVNMEPTEVREDTRMRRIGRDDARGVFIYAPVQPLKGDADAGNEEGGAIYFLKTAPRQYLKVSPAPARP